jgi:hypothetical protein
MGSPDFQSILQSYNTDTVLTTEQLYDIIEARED